MLLAQKIDERAQGIGHIGVLGERKPNRPRRHGGLDVDFKQLSVAQTALCVFARQTADAHAVRDKALHEVPASHFHGGNERRAEALGEVVEGGTRHRVRLHKQERIVLQIPDGELLALELGERLPCKEHVIEKRNGIRDDDAVIGRNGQVEESDVAAVRLEKFDDARRYVGDELDLHLRTELVIGDDLLGENVLEDGLRSADAQRSSRALLHFGEFVLHAVQETERLFHVGIDEHSALLGELHALVYPIEERRAELRLQLLDRLRDGWLGNIEFLCRLGKTTAPRHRVKYLIQFQIYHVFLP